MWGAGVGRSKVHIAPDLVRNLLWATLMPSSTYPAVDEELLLGRLLVKQGLISQKQLVEALRSLGERDGTLGDRLVELGFLRPSQRPGLQEVRPGPSFTLDRFPCAFGKFELREQIERGRMRRVIRAWEKNQRRVVAIKLVEVMEGGSSRAMTERERMDLVAEARAAARLAHPNIVQIYEVGRIEGEDYIAMELVDGVSLKGYVRSIWRTREAGRRFVRRRLRALLGHVRELAQAMEYAHSAGVMHRDIKPGNILVEFEEGPPEEGAPPEIRRLKLADFGLAIDLDQDARVGEAHKLIGTPGYMSPEQARGRGFRWMPAGDVFSLGVAVYELLTGVTLFLRDSREESLRAVREEDPEPPSRRNPDLDAGVDRIVMGCLGREAWERFPRARALAEAIESYLEGKTVRAPARRRTETTAIRRTLAGRPSGRAKPRAVLSKSVEAFFERARGREESGDLGGALADYSRVLQKVSRHDGARLRRGTVLFALGDVDGAIEDWTVAIQKDPGNVEAYARRAMALRQNHRTIEAIDDYRQALEVAPAAWPNADRVRRALEKLGGEGEREERGRGGK